jgi:hypothetical protein
MRIFHCPEKKMDSHADTDSILLAFLNGVGDQPLLNENSMHSRSDSALSIASTIALDTVSMPLHPHVIKTFCPFNQLFVSIAFPSEENGWVYRDDVGGQSQHRWDFEETIFLISRYSTCNRAIEIQRPCRNCIMKDVWRRECIQPENAFFLCARSMAKDPTPALNKVMLRCDAVPPDLASKYIALIPKCNNSRKRRRDRDTRQKQIYRMMEQVASRNQTANAPQPSDPEEADDFMNLIGNALGMNQPTTEGHLHVDSHEPKLASLQTVATCLDSNISDIDRPRTEESTTQASDSCVPGMVSAYGRLLDLFGNNSRACITDEFIRQLQADFPSVFTTESTSVPCEALSALLQRIQVVPHKPALLLTKFIFLPWFTRLKHLCRDSPARIGLGFYHSPSSSLHAEFCESSLSPIFISSDCHRIAELYSFSGSLPNTMLVLYIVDPVISLVIGSNILPIANLA